MLNDRFIRSAKTGFHSDGHGLYLQVYPSGRRVFIYRDQAGGKQRKQVLGAYPALSLAEARERCQRLRAGVAIVTATDAFNQYYRHLRTQYRDPSQVKRMIDKELLAEHGGRAIGDITRLEYAALLQKIVDRGSPVMANRALTALKKFLAFCEQRGLVQANALNNVQRQMIGGRERAKDRNLTEAEIEAFLQALPTWGISSGTHWALVGCLLTGCRASEILAVSPHGAVEQTKNGTRHQIPLTPLVRFWLRQRPESLPRDHRVLSHALRRQTQDFTPHDLRRTYASRLADLGVPPHVIEKLLNHQMTGVMAVYNRAEYWPERIAAQRQWDKFMAKNTPELLRG